MSPLDSWVLIVGLTAPVVASGWLAWRRERRRARNVARLPIGDRYQRDGWRR